MYKVIALSCLLLIVACSNQRIDEHPTTSTAVTSTATPKCIGVINIKSTTNAEDISRYASACAQQSKPDKAAELVFIASAYAFFDTRRVADKTAHTALGGIFKEAFSSLAEAKKNNVYSSVKKLDRDMSRKKQLCSQLSHSGPPRYFPRYMIDYGTTSIGNSQSQSIVDGFDAQAAWSEALQFVHCK